MVRLIGLIVVMMVVKVVPAGIAAAEPRVDASPCDSGQAWTLEGRLCFDVASYREQRNHFSNGAILRYGRLGGRFCANDKWLAAVHLSLNCGEIEVEEAWACYSGLGAKLRAGYFKEPIGLEVQTSSLHNPFMERSLAAVFSPWRSIGLAIAKTEARWSVQAGLFGPDLDDCGGDAGWAATGRGTICPIQTKRALLHAGVGLTRRTPDSDSSGGKFVVLKTAPETKVEDCCLLNTGQVNAVRSWTTIGYELAAKFDRILITGEYVTHGVVRDDVIPSFQTEGGYLSLSFAVRGRQREYDSDRSVFGSLPSNGGIGSMEIVCRASWVDLNDRESGIMGGRTVDFTVGLNWRPNSRVRLLLDHTWVDNDECANGNGSFYGNDDYSFIQSRMQVNF